ncbi:MAG: hypothetical protein OJF50_000912 [Nitrospira sp.]|nr:hypothetical protein [Nitrospira sp.]
MASGRTSSARKVNEVVTSLANEGILPHMHAVSHDVGSQ